MGSVEKFNPKYFILIEEDVNLNNSVKVLLLVFNSLNHMQVKPLNYSLNVEGFQVNKAIKIKPGERITIAYNKDDQRLNNNYRKYNLISSHIFKLIYDIQFWKILTFFFSTTKSEILFSFSFLMSPYQYT